MHRRQFAGTLLAVPALLSAEPYIELDELTPRDRFFQGGTDHSRWTGIRVAILLRREIPGAPCLLKEIASDEILRSGDRIQLRVQPNAQGFLYILTEDQDGRHRLLYPTLDDERGSNAIQAFQSVAAPQTDWLRFDDEPGVDPVLVLFSGQPIDKLEDLRRKDAVLSARELHHLVAAQSADLPQRETSEARNGSIPCIFSVALSDSGTDVIVERIELTHRPARKRG